MPLASTGSRLLSGNRREWEELESDFARFAGHGSGALFRFRLCGERWPAQLDPAAGRRGFLRCAQSRQLDRRHAALRRGQRLSIRTSIWPFWRRRCANNERRAGREGDRHRKRLQHGGRRCAASRAFESGSRVWRGGDCRRGARDGSLRAAGARNRRRTRMRARCAGHRAHLRKSAGKRRGFCVRRERA